MNLYEKNMEALKEHQINLYEELKKIEEEPKEPRVAVTEKRAINGEPVLEVTKGAKTYRLQSLYSPTHENEVWCDQFKEKSLQKIYILFGFGNGSTIKMLKEREQKNAVIIIYEPSYDIFLFALHHYDLTEIIEQDGIVITVRNINDKDFTSTLGNAVEWYNIEGEIIATINGYRHLFETEYIIFIHKVIENNTKIMVHRNTAAFFGKSDTYNSIENIKYMSDSNNVCDLIPEIPDDVPAIVVAGGPSLDKNIEDLKAAKGKAVIICVDRALDTLIAHDILPDFSITIDPEKPPRFYDNPVSLEIPMFYHLSANRKIIGRHTGRKIIFTKNVFSDELYKRLDISYINTAPGGSVATGAFATSIALGIKNIILVGQDLAYENGLTHTGGVKLGEEVKDNNLLKVKGIHGGEVYTGPDMYNYLLWYQDTIQNYKDKINVVDATEGGALIRGTKIMTLKEAIKEYCVGTFDSKKAMEHIRITDSKHREEVTLKILEDMLEQFTEMIEMFKKAERLCADLLTNVIEHRGLNSKGIQMSKKLAEVNNKIQGMFATEIVENFTYENAAKDLETINDLTEEKITDQRKTFEQSRSLYESYRKGCKELLAYMEPYVEEFRKTIS